MANVVMDELKDAGFVPTEYHTMTFGISIAYYALIHVKDYDERLRLEHGVEWIDVNLLPRLYSDHNRMVEKALKLMRQKMRTEPVGFKLGTEEVEGVWIPMFYGSVVSGKMRSLSGLQPDYAKTTADQKTAIDVAQARGVTVLSAARRNVPVSEYTPLQVKLSVTGYGKAEKHQVMEMTRQLLGLAQIPKPDDAADALAIAICHGHSVRWS